MSGQFNVIDCSVNAASRGKQRRCRLMKDLLAQPHPLKPVSRSSPLLRGLYFLIQVWKNTAWRLLPLESDMLYTCV